MWRVYAHADYGLISCGYNNRYGHPHTEVLQGLAQEGTKVLRTDEMGAVVFGGDKKLGGYNNI